MTWLLHWLEASGDLRPWRDAVAREVEITRRAVARLLPVPALDILVQRMADAVIPEAGMAGHAHHRSLLALTLDPDNANFERCLQGGMLHRTLAYEVHHCLRMAGPGYGRTLGEALVSEGLAGRFTGHLFRTPPEPWEQAVTDDVLQRYLPDAAVLASDDYDHAGWFFGAGGHRPRWLGYTLGHRIVGDWLASAAEVDGKRWVGVPADEVLAATRGRMLPRS